MVDNKKKTFRPSFYYFLYRPISKTFFAVFLKSGVKNVTILILRFAMNYQSLFQVIWASGALVWGIYIKHLCTCWIFSWLSTHFCWWLQKYHFQYWFYWEPPRMYICGWFHWLQISQEKYLTRKSNFLRIFIEIWDIFWDFSFFDLRKHI